MKESLIGEEISLTGPSDDVVAMLLQAAAAFLEAADADPPEVDRWLPDLESAMVVLQPQPGSQVVVRLQTTEGGMRVSLRLSTAPDRESTFLCNL